MARKNLGKVRRFRSGYYRSNGYWLRRLIKIALLLVALFVVGWCVGPFVIDLGTSTWYGMKKGGSPAPTGPATATVTPIEAATATPTPTLVPLQELQGEPDTEKSWAFVTLSALASEKTARETAEGLAQQGVGYAVITLKDSQGYIYYPSKAALAAKSVTTFEMDMDTALDVLREYGISPVANLYMYRDPIAPYTDTARTTGIHYQNTDYYWLDAAAENGGKPWLNPYSDDAFNYLDEILDEVIAMGFDEVMLNGVQFPGGNSSSCNYGNTGGRSKIDQLSSLVDKWQQKAEQKKIRLWFEYGANVAAADEENPSNALGAPISRLGVKNLIVTAPEVNPEDEVDVDLILQQALENCTGAEYVVVRDGRSGEFR